MAASVSAHSRRALKSDISYLDEAAERRAYDEVKALRHSHFRYKAGGPKAPLVRGLIYEDAPESIRSAPGKSIVLENRLATTLLWNCGGYPSDQYDPRAARQSGQHWAYQDGPPPMHPEGSDPRTCYPNKALSLGWKTPWRSFA